MASIISKTNPFSSLRSPPLKENPDLPLRRGYHIELGTREKALLEEDPALKRFKSYKKSVGRVKKLGDALSIVVVAVCSYEIYVNAVKKREKFEKNLGF